MKDIGGIKTFKLVRSEDVSGVSGTGIVAEGVIFTSGKVVVSFLPHTAGVANVIVYDDIIGVETVHGHGGKTVVEYD